MKLALTILLCSLATLSYAKPIPQQSKASLASNNVNILSVSALESASDLIDKLEEMHSKDVAPAQGASAWALKKSKNIFKRDWWVAAIHSCSPEVGPTRAIGRMLVCPEESAGPCTLSVTYTDSQTFTDSVGIHSSFSVEGNIIAAKASATFGAAYTYTESYSQGQSLSYQFQLPEGTTCTPTQAAYQLKCTAAVWKVQKDKSKPSCDSLTGLDFADKTKWFQYEDDSADWWQYVYNLGTESTQLLSFKVNNKDRFQPTSCGDIKEIEARAMSVERNDGESRQSVSFSSTQSISAVTCVYSDA